MNNLDDYPQGNIASFVIDNEDNKNNNLKEEWHGKDLSDPIEIHCTTFAK